MMKIAIIDADLIGRKKHRFPNLACEKISGYWKEKGAEVKLLLSYDDIALAEGQLSMFDGDKEYYDRVYISKVFTDTPVPEWVEKLKEVPQDENSRIQIGGTGFFFDKAPDLAYEIEHHMPDYDLYNDWIQSEVERAEAEAKEKGHTFNKSRYMVQFKEYTDYSIGFMTRGCFRQCKFCVNQKYNRVNEHSPLEEFYDPTRKKICLLDDNFFGLSAHIDPKTGESVRNWRDILSELKATGKQFKFKQGIDERLLTEEKCQKLFDGSYDGDFTFAFDNIADYDLIHEKLQLIDKYRKQYKRNPSIKFYVLVGFESTDEIDIENMWKRVALLMQYQCLPYIMRYQNKNETPWKDSEYRGMYVTMARWCNQPNFFKKKSFRQFCEANQALVKTDGSICASKKAMDDFEEKHPKIAEKYFDLRYDDYLLE